MKTYSFLVMELFKTIINGLIKSAQILFLIAVLVISVTAFNTQNPAMPLGDYLIILLLSLVYSKLIFRKE